MVSCDESRLHSNCLVLGIYCDGGGDFEQPFIYQAF